MRVLTIANIETPVIEHNNQPVVTTIQLARFYECDTQRISENFKRNEKRFTEGKHFYKLTGEALRRFKDSIGNTQFAKYLKFAPHVYL